MSAIKKDILIFFIIFIIVYIVSILYLTTPDYDFLNYQAYNCYSLLNNRFSQDFFVGNSRSCYNPYIYLPEYLLMYKLNNHPYFFIMISIMDTVISLFLVYKILKLALTSTTKNEENSILTGLNIFLCIVYVAFSPIMLNVADFSRSDAKISVLILLSFYLIIKNIFSSNYKQKNISIIFAGLMLGITITIKYSSIDAVIVFVFIMLLFSRKINNPYKTILLFCFSVFAGFILTDGYWLYYVNKYYHNPIFPYFNNFFKSEFAENLKLIDFDYGQLAPTNLIEYIFYAFFKDAEVHYWGIEDYIYDPRYAINFLLTVYIVIYSLYTYIKKTTNKLFTDANKNVCICIILFSIMSYYVNLSLFGTYRYIISSSMLYGVILLLVLSCLFSYIKNTNIRKWFISFTLIYIVAFSYLTCDYGIYPPMNYVNYKNKEWKIKKITKIYESQKLKIDDNYKVILFSTPTSIAAINQNPKAYYIGLPIEAARKTCNIYEWNYSKFLLNKIDEIFKENEKCYIIYVYVTLDEYLELKYILDYWSKKYNRKIDNCENIDIKFFSTKLNYKFKKCEFIKSN